MRKSEMYRLAQGAVVTNALLSINDKLDIIRELIEQEDLALYTENREMQTEEMKTEVQG